MSVRAKFRCNSVEMTSPEPVQQLRYTTTATGRESTGVLVWSRIYRFSAVYDTTVPEDQRYALATPYAELKIQVDNPAVSFTPGESYYLDFTQVEAPTLTP